MFVGDGGYTSDTNFIITTHCWHMMDEEQIQGLPTIQKVHYTYGMWVSIDYFS